MRFLPVAVLAIALAFLMSLDATVVRQASVVGMGDCSLRQFLNLPPKVDVLALGSSRVRAGISTEAIARASGGALRNSFNFGRSGLSALRSYITLRDVLDRGVQPRFVFMEVDLDALQDTQVSAPIRMPGNVAFMKYADLGLLLELPERMSMLASARLYALTLLDKIRGSIIPVLTTDPLWASVNRRSEPVASCQGRADFERTEKGELALDALRLKQPPNGNDIASAQRAFHAGADGSSPRQQELLFIGKARQLARAHGAALVVARHGEAYEPPLSAEAVAAIRRDIPEFVQPPDALVRGTWSDFLDATHMGPKARDTYSTWLAGQMMASANR